MGVVRNQTTTAASPSLTQLFWSRAAQVSPEPPQSSDGPEEDVDDQFCGIARRVLNRPGQCKVLVVDDSKVSNKVLIRVLKQIFSKEQQEERERPVALDRSRIYRQDSRDVSTPVLELSFAEADDGSTALQQVQEALAEGNPFDIVFMDNTMIHMNGPEAAQGMRSAGFKGLIVGVTGNVMAHDVANYVASGADCVVFKPVNTEELKQIFTDSFLA